FKAAGYQGLNFANIGDVAHYHTPLDNLENADPGTLEHHGDNAMPAVLALANSDLANPPQRDAVFFDVFENGMIWWPATWTRAMALGAAFLLIFQIVWLFRTRRLEPNAFVWGLFGWLEIVVVTGMLALILQWVIRWAGALPVNWVAHPLPLQVAFWSLGFSAVVVVTLASARRAGFWGLWTGVWTWWSLLSVLIAWNEPGISYVILLPSLAAALTGLPFTLRRRETTGGAGLAAILPLLIAATLAFSPIMMLYVALGNRAIISIAVLVAVILTPLAPLLEDSEETPGILRVAMPGIPIAITLLAACAAVVVPIFSAKAPERANILYWLDGDAGKAEWIVNPASGHLPDALQVAAAFRHADAAPFPWSTGVSFLADAPRLADAAPTFTVEQTVHDTQHNRTSYRALLRSERGAPDAMILFPPDAGVDSVRVADVPVEPETKRVRAYMNGWAAYDCLTMNPKGIEITFTLPDGKPVAVYAVDESYGLPAEGMFLLKARPLTATQSDGGDRTVVSRRVELLP
ncbi:MAG: M28 family peptidase, partial [Candidatus Acidiferrales bacterium]